MGEGCGKSLIGRKESDLMTHGPARKLNCLAKVRDFVDFTVDECAYLAIRN